MQNSELLKKWEPLLESEGKGFGKVVGFDKRAIMATMLEETEKAIAADPSQHMQSLFEVAPTNFTGGAIANYSPVLISLVRRAMPNLIAYDVMGVQPMTGPVGLIFSMRSHYGNSTGTEAFYDEANTHGSTFQVGNNETVGTSNLNLGTTPTGNSQTYNFAAGMSTIQAEALGSSSNVDFQQMAFSINSISVTAKSRALKAEWSIELAQDLKAIHGLDAEAELANILSTEILADINRELIRTIYVTAVTGSPTGTVTTAGTYDLDTDSNGRWMAEKFKGLMFHIEREANLLAKQTRRGKGNIIICSSDVASALDQAGKFDYTPAANSNNLNVDDTGNTFVGVLNGRYRVYVDPYASVNYMVIGYKGSSAFDAGLFYCPYVPIQMVRAVGETTFQPKIGMKTRYGVVANPFSRGSTASDGSLVHNSNVYYRRSLVTNIS